MAIHSRISSITRFVEIDRLYIVLGAFITLLSAGVVTLNLTLAT